VDAEAEGAGLLQLPQQSGPSLEHAIGVGVGVGSDPHSGVRELGRRVKGVAERDDPPGAAVRR